MSRMRTACAVLAAAMAIGSTTGCASPITSAAPGAPATSAVLAMLGALPAPPATAVPLYLAWRGPGGEAGRAVGFRIRTSIELKITSISRTADSVTAG